MSKDNMKSSLKKALLASRNEGYKSGFEKGRKSGIITSVENYSSVVLFCLKDKFDFDNDQMKALTIAINETFHCVCEGHLTFDDIRDTMKLENNLEITFTGDVNLKETTNDESLPSS